MNSEIVTEQDYPRGLTLNLKNVEEARKFLRETKSIDNPANVTHKKPTRTIRVLLENDYKLLNEGVIGMHNMKMYRVVKGPKQYFWE